MQRLNAITSFIEGEFSLHGSYFDLDTIAETKYLLDNGHLKQKEPKLNRELCKNIASYQLPLSVSIFNKESAIDDIFKRINSNGKHLSSQELRQAGSTSSFGRIVRKLSENIRGDVSHSDRLTLNNMKKISINNTNLSYGINMGGIFWRKHGIITNENLRGSRDEELIANLLSAILIKPSPAATSNNLNKFYDGERHIENEIKKLGESYIIRMFEAVFSAIRQTFESTRSSFSKIVFKDKTEYVNRSFQVFFLAFYELLVKEQLKIASSSKMAIYLEGKGDKYLTAHAEFYNLSKQREESVEIVKGLIRQFFVKRNENDPALNNGVIKLETLLGASETEGTNYDFKIGLHRLDHKGLFDDNCFEKILKTLSAIANASKDSIGYVVIGVADNPNAAKIHDVHYNAKSLSYKNFFVTGVQCEASKYKTHEDYMRVIENKIKSSSLSPSKYKDQILRNLDFFKYYDKSVLIFRIEN